MKDMAVCSNYSVKLMSSLVSEMAKRIYLFLRIKQAPHKRDKNQRITNYSAWLNGNPQVSEMVKRTYDSCRLTQHSIVNFSFELRTSLSITRSYCKKKQSQQNMSIGNPNLNEGLTRIGSDHNGPNYFKTKKKGGEMHCKFSKLIPMQGDPRFHLIEQDPYLIYFGPIPFFYSFPSVVLLKQPNGLVFQGRAGELCALSWRDLKEIVVGRGKGPQNQP